MFSPSLLLYVVGFVCFVAGALIELNLRLNRKSDEIGKSDYRPTGV